MRVTSDDTHPATRTVDGVHYTVTGDGPRTVVLLHGFADNLATWARIVPPLAVDHRVIAIDLPGFGRSTRDWRGPSLIDGYVDVVAEVLDAEGLAGPVSVVGNSMGAVVGAAFARRHPERTGRIVLIDVPGLAGVPKLWRMALCGPAELGLRASARMLGPRPSQVGIGLFYGIVASGAAHGIDPVARAGFCEPYLTAGAAGIADILPVGRALLRDLARAPLAALVDALDLPVLVVFGSRDRLTPARTSRRVGRDGRVVVLPGCGHCPQLDRPADLLAHVAPFLRSPLSEAVAAAA